MAILPGFPYVRVCVRGSQIQEYYDPDGPPLTRRQNKMSVYISSTTKKSFNFEYYVNKKQVPPGTCLGFFAIIDGHRSSSITICNENGFKPNEWVHCNTGDRVKSPNGETCIREFSFAEIKIVDGEVPAFSSNDTSQLGELIVQVWRIRKGKVVPRPTTQPANAPTDNTTYHEKQLKGKAVSHATKFGPERAATHTETFFQVEYIDPVDKPMVEFHFKYRSKEVLQQMMIIPRDIDSPQKPPPPMKRPQPAPATAVVKLERSNTETQGISNIIDRVPRYQQLSYQGIPAIVAAQNQAFAMAPAMPAMTFRPSARSTSKCDPATPVETRTQALYRPDAMAPAKAGLRAAYEPMASSFTRVMDEINKNINHFRNVAKSTVVGFESRSVFSQVEDQIMANNQPNIKREQNAPIKREQPESIKRERVQASDDELEVVLERPVKRRHIFTEADTIFDLTGDN